MTKVITFYSYKGGVGRTMALVNAAHVLARRGLRVLMVDLDLEAPGMTHYFIRQVREHAKATSKDALDLLLEVRKNCPVGKIEPLPFEPVSLADHVVPIALPAAWVEERTSESPYLVGRLDLLPATFDPSLSPSLERSYLERLSALDLPGVFGPEGPGHRFGYEVRRRFENTRFEAPGDVVFTLREVVKASYDLVLVDSRTGLNEISGLCIGPLCDALVVCTGLNEQNVVGTQYFMEQTGLFDKEKSKPYAVVVGPVPPWTRPETESRLERIKEALHVKDVAATVPYHPAAALGEPVFVVADPEEAIAATYEVLAKRIMELGQVLGSAKPKVRGQAFNDSESQNEVAGELSAWRLAYRRSVRELPKDTFPTAVVLRRLQDWDDWDRWGVVETSAVVAALHLRSELPFESILARARRTGENVTGALLMARFRITDRLPLRIQGSWVERCLLQGPNSISEGLAFVYAAALGMRSEVWDPRLIDPVLPFLAAQSSWPLELRQFLVPESALSVLGPKPNIKIKAKVVNGSIGALEVLRNKDWRDPGPSYGPGSIGLWPLPFMASLVSLVKGPKAIDEILGWLDLCRQVHGYAWRVLVDWRHLASIRKHPKFVAFVKEEDERVAVIEAAIDSGEYPL